MDKAAIVILHYKGEQDTHACIQSIFSGKANRNAAVILVTNTAPSEFINTIRKKYPTVIILENKENVGFAEGCNTGLRYAVSHGYSSMILLNNDTLVSDQWLPALLKSKEKFPEAGVVSPKIYFAKGNEYHHERYKESERGKIIWYAGGIIDWANVYASHRGVDEVDHGQYDTPAETDFATGCCMLIRREVIESIGYLDAKYFLYYEDVDYSLRAQAAGFSVVYWPQASIWHKNAASSGRPGSPVHQYYQTRNRLFFGFRYAPVRTKAALFRESIRMLLKGGIAGRAVKDYYFHTMGKADL